MSETKKVEPYYSNLSQPDLDRVSELVGRVGYTPIIAALGDILTQSPKTETGGVAVADLALALGMAMAKAQEVDRVNPQP
jgi:hypothetical protein